MTTLVVIPCGQRKALAAAPARSLYTGPYYQACLAWGTAWEQAGATLRILSARHGLVDPEMVLAPYEQRMGTAGAVTAAVVRRQMREQCLTPIQVLAVGGRLYTQVIRECWPYVECPFDLLPKGRNGMGYQVAWLRSHCP